MKKTLLLLLSGILLVNFILAQTDSEKINSAIISGNCAALYEYIQRDKTDTDPRLVTSATTALRRYTSLDSAITKYRTDKMDQKVRRVSGELMEKVFNDPEKTLPDVVSFLSNGVSDQLLKAKILHDWICDNIAYDTELYFTGRAITNQDYAYVLNRKKAVCSGYSALFNKMCQLAGIESIGITGYSKGFGYSGRIGSQTDHEWNAVHIGSKWYLVDVTWDAGYVEIKTFIKRYSTTWLFLDSRPFLYSHLPEKEQYQYFAPILTANEFMFEAYIPGVFFKYGLSLASEKPGYNNTTNGKFVFDIGIKNSNVLVSSILRTASQQDINSSSWSERKGSAASFEFDVPDSNNYKGFIFARFNNSEKIQDRIDIRTFESDWLPRAEALFNVQNARDRKITEKELEYFRTSYFKVQENENYYFLEDQFDNPRYNAVLKIHKLLDISTGMLEPVLDFNLKAAPEYSGYGRGILKYPNTYSAYNQVSGTQLISPLAGTLKAGSDQEFAVSSKDFSNIAIIINGEWNLFTKNSKTGIFEFSFTVPEGIESLVVSGVTTTGNRMTARSLVQFNVIE